MHVRVCACARMFSIVVVMMSLVCFIKSLVHVSTAVGLTSATLIDHK